MSPLTATLVPLLTPKGASVSGMTLIGLSTLAFAFLPHLPSRTPFFAAAIALRILAAIGSALMSTAAFSQLLLHFSDRISNSFVSCLTCIS